LGLTTGILDAVALGKCLDRIINRKEHSDLLDRYAKVRRDAWVNYTNPQSTEFKQRIHFFVPETVEKRDAFFDTMNNDPEMSLKMARAMNEIIEDEFDVRPAAIPAEAPATEALKIVDVSA